MSTPTVAQIDALLNFLEEHRDLARGNLRSIEGRSLSHRLWEEICATLNAMGGCTKTTKQWQKVWTDKKYLAKKAAAAVRRSASATGGGPSTAPSLSQWELKIISIMGDGFGEPQTSARVPAFFDHTTQEVSTAASTQYNENEDLVPLNDPVSEPQDIELDTYAQSNQPTSTPSIHASITHDPITSTQQRRRYRRRSASLRSDSSVRDRLFQLEERRTEREEQRNTELAGIRMAVEELCRLMQQLVEQLPSRIQQ